MRVKIFMAALVTTLMLGVQGYACPWNSACIDPCGPSCDRQVVRGGDLFSGLKRLVNGVRVANHCDPCAPVVACNPCDMVACNPCDPIGCGLPRLGLGDRLRNLIASARCAPSWCGPCDAVACDPCDPARFVNCDPCAGVNFCGPPRRPLRLDLNPFRNLRLNRGCFVDCDPCAPIADCFHRCDPCLPVARCLDGCFVGPCDFANGCFDGCSPRGRLLDLPRFNLSRLFDRNRFARCAVECAPWGPCDHVGACDAVCCR